MIATAPLPAPAAPTAVPATPAPDTGGRPRAQTSYATGGMVASASSVAAAVGVRTLMDGGNAFDAAIATALVEHLTLPASCGLGGDMFAVLYDAKTNSVHGINGSGVGARKADRD